MAFDNLIKQTRGMPNNWFLLIGSIVLLPYEPSAIARLKPSAIVAAGFLAQLRLLFVGLLRKFLAATVLQVG